MEQRSEEWYQARGGRVTASRFKDVITNGRGGKPSKTAQSYMYELLVEKINGEVIPIPPTYSMQWGIDAEPRAIAAYEKVTGTTVKSVGFVEYGEYVGVSPDGLVGSEGLIEIKCPDSKTAVKNFFERHLYDDYKAQVQGQLWVTNRQWCDFLVFDDRLRSGAQYVCERIGRDEDFIDMLKSKVIAFTERMKELYETASQKHPDRPYFEYEPELIL